MILIHVETIISQYPGWCCTAKSELAFVAWNTVLMDSIKDDELCLQTESEEWKIEAFSERAAIVNTEYSPENWETKQYKHLE